VGVPHYDLVRADGESLITMDSKWTSYWEEFRAKPFDMRETLHLIRGRPLEPMKPRPTPLEEYGPAHELRREIFSGRGWRETGW
jgi:hypothetical protein